MEHHSTLKRIPLTYKVLILTVMVGLISWGILDYVQSRQLKAIFDVQLAKQLNIQAQEARVRFDNYVEAQHAAVKLSVSQKRFSDYLSKTDIGVVTRIKYYRDYVPPWMPDASAMRGLVQISYALLMDGKGNVKEVYQSLPTPPPLSLMHPSNLLRELSFNQSLMTNVDGVPFVITAEPVFSHKEIVAILMIASPLNDDFLIASQGLSNERITVALVSGGEHVILASNRPDDLPAGTSLNAIRDRYRITGKSFFDTGSSDLLVEFVSLISNDKYDAISRAVLFTGREQRAITVLILVSFFVLIMLWITRRIGHLTWHIADFSERVLHGTVQGSAHGDELDILDERFHRLMQEVVSSQEIIRRDYHFQSTVSSILRSSLEPISLDEQMERIMDAILSLPFLSSQSRGCIYLVEDNPGILVMKAHRGLPESMRAACSRVRFGKCLCGLTASTRDIVFADSTDSCHEIEYDELPPHGHYCVPIVSGGRVLGAMNLYVEKGHERDAEEERLLTSIANTLAGVILRTRTETEKEKLQTQLVEAEKLSALGRLTANIAHEIRHPLTSIGGFARRLDKKMLSGTREKEYAGIITTQVRNLENILKNVLTYSRETHLFLNEYDLNEIIDESLNLYNELCEKQSIGVRKLFGDIPKIRVDKLQVKETIDNLLSNAIDSMPKGGSLTISTKKEKLNEKTYAIITIADTGAGIAEDRLGMIFEPFFTTKVLGRGTGLGLSICKKIMEDHGGFIRFESNVGEGSTVSLYFPYKEQSIAFGNN
jgi:signal transduction histidine kinase